MLSEKEGPLVSIIVPVYNVEQYLERCLRSICGQTYSNLEIILIDDGSTDGSGQICDAWEKKDNRIKVVHKVNGGLSSARNAALDLMTGDYVGFVDSDDFIVPQMYEKLLGLAKEHDADVVHSEFFVISDGNVTVGQENGIRIVNADEAFLYFAEYEKWSVWGKIYTAAIWKDIRFREGRYFEDVLSFSDVANVAHKWVLTEEKYYGYNTGNVSITRCDMTERHLRDILESRMQLAKHVATLHTLPQEAAYFVYRSWLNYFDLMYKSKEISGQTLKAAWKKMKPLFEPLYKEAKKSDHYRSMSVLAKMRWLGFRYLPMVSQKIKTVIG